MAIDEENVQKLDQKLRQKVDLRGKKVLVREATIKGLQKNTDIHIADPGAWKKKAAEAEATIIAYATKDRMLEKAKSIMVCANKDIKEHENQLKHQEKKMEMREKSMSSLETKLQEREKTLKLRETELEKTSFKDAHKREWKTGGFRAKEVRGAMLRRIEKRQTARDEMIRQVWQR